MLTMYMKAINILISKPNTWLKLRSMTIDFTNCKCFSFNLVISNLKTWIHRFFLWSLGSGRMPQSVSATEKTTKKLTNLINHTHQLFFLNGGHRNLLYICKRKTERKGYISIGRLVRMKRLHTPQMLHWSLSAWLVAKAGERKGQKFSKSSANAEWCAAFGTIRQRTTAAQTRESSQSPTLGPTNNTPSAARQPRRRRACERNQTPSRSSTRTSRCRRKVADKLNLTSVVGEFKISY